MAELVLGKLLGGAYIAFGQQYEQALWSEFEKDTNPHLLTIRKGGCKPCCGDGSKPSVGCQLSTKNPL